MPSTGKGPSPRTEAQPFTWDKLSEDQRDAARGICGLLSSIAQRDIAPEEEQRLGSGTGSVFERGRVPIDVRVTDGEVAFLAAAQIWLRRQLAAREITVESNPSSNLLIGDLGSLREHPSFRLQPLPGMASDQPLLPLSINTDDPVSFATSLADEYAYMYAALLRSGISSSDALGWLDARRRDGYRSRFTLAASAEPSVLRAVALGPTSGAARRG